jgi:hypothetical protein
MPFARAMQTQILSLILRGEDINGIAVSDADPIPDFSISLHTADPTDLGTQATNEIAYTGYARRVFARLTGEAERFNVADGVASPSVPLDFPQCSAGGGIVTHIGIGLFTAGPGVLMLCGELDDPIVIEPGDIPRLTTASTFTLR